MARKPNANAVKLAKIKEAVTECLENGASASQTVHRINEILHSTQNE